MNADRSGVTFERSRDWDLIRLIVTHPRIWPWISDDFSGPPEEWQPVDHSNVCYVIARDGEEVLGLWMVHPHSAVLWEIHTCLLPTCGTKRAIAAAAEMIRWVWENTPAKRLVSQVPEFNRRAAWFARRAGMQEFGRNPKSYQKDGKLHDQALYGLSPQ